MDLREYITGDDEWLHAIVDGLRKHIVSSLPAIVEKDGDGHTVTVKSAIKGKRMKEDGTVVDFEMPLFQDVPSHFTGGGGVTSTHPNKKGDEGIISFVSRAQDAWHQQGDVQQPVDNRMHAFSDGRFVPGGRSDPRKLKNVSNEAIHHRSDDAKVTHEVHPTGGMKTKVVDASWHDPGDGSSDPFKKATKFVETLHDLTGKIAHNATNGGTTHSVTNSHDDGPQMAANNGEHTIGTHPSGGAKIMSSSGLMKIKGQIESFGDGFKFPDGSIQKSAALAIATFTGGSAGGGGGAGASFPTLASDTPIMVAGKQQTNGPAFAAYATVATSIPTAVSTVLIMDTPDFDPASAYSATTGRFNPQVPGYYQITGGNGFAAAQPKLTLSIFKNGVEFRRGNQEATGGLRSVVSGLTFLNGTTDYVDLRLYHEAGSTQSSLTGIPTAYFEGAMVRGQ